MKKLAYKLGTDIGFLIGKSLISGVSAFVLGLPFFLVYNHFVLGFFNNKPITYIQSVGLLFLIYLVLEI